METDTENPLGIAENVTKAGLAKRLAALGYKIEESSSFNYLNNLNPPHSWPARSCYVVEADTGISFAHYQNARRDANFKQLQALRQHSYNINGRIYEL